VGIGTAVARVGHWLTRAAEGQYRPGPYPLPVTGGVLSAYAGSFMNWWQMGYDPVGMSSQSAMVEACVSAYAQTVAMLPGDHWLLKKNGGRDRVTTSALSRILRRPNTYQSISDFMLNATRALYLDGNAYALALRNDRFEVDELHLMDSRQSYPQIAVNGDIFYRLAGNDVIDRQLQVKQITVPQRDVLHIRLHCVERKRPFPLKGETPLTAALMDLAAGSAIQNQQIQFYMNQARPSAVLSTDAILKQEQVDQLRQMWNEQAKGLEAGCGPGGTPILTAGLKVQPWATPGKDAQIAEMAKMSEDRIALAFRIPLAILGMGGTVSSTEQLTQQWLASGLGFCLNHIEEAFGLLFQLKGQPDEYLELNTAALLRSNARERIETLVRGVQGGVYSPDEAREMEGLPNVPGGWGKEPRVQQQVVPLSAAAGIPKAPGPGAPGAAPSATGVDGTPGDGAPTDGQPDAKKPEEKPAPTKDWHKQQVLHAVNRHDRRTAA
jgi:HK97 family phage portal protein